MRVHHPLNLASYIKSDAEDELEKGLVGRDFSTNIKESRFTRFYEDYWLPKRFGFENDARTFSSLIMTNQMDSQRL